MDGGKLQMNYKGFYMYDTRLLSLDESSAEFKVAHRIIRKENLQRLTKELPIGTVQISQIALAKELKLSQKTISVSIKKLVEKGILLELDKSSTKGKTSIYGIASILYSEVYDEVYDEVYKGISSK